VQVNTRVDTISNISSFYQIKASKLLRHYKKQTSGYKDWQQKGHADEYTLYPANVTPSLSIDEVCLSKGELYTVVTNKNEGVHNRGSLVAMIKGTDSKTIVSVLNKIPLAQRNLVKEITMDMARTMSAAAAVCFPHAQQVIDRFHVVRLVMDAMQHARIKYRWQVIEAENVKIKEAKSRGEKYMPDILENGDTLKGLLARSKYLFYKFKTEWTKSQIQRAGILFDKFPLLKEAYELVVMFRNIYESTSIGQARLRFNHWMYQVKKSQIEVFNTCVNSLEYHLEEILLFFANRETNANAESFNSKIKQFRSEVRGVRDSKFFLFRLEKLFAC
jgi:transposase